MFVKSFKSVHRRVSPVCCLFLLFTLVFSISAYGGKVKILYDDQEAFRVRADVIRQAKSELLISYFVVRDDTASVSGFALLLDAADRGVKVRVMLDAFHQDISRPFLKVLTSHPNIEIRAFNRLSIFHLFRAFRRTHEKIILADNIHTPGFHYITGGRNVSNKYFGFGIKRNFDDLDIYVHGESAQIARDQYYVRQWEGRLVSDISLGSYSTENLDHKICPQAKKQNDQCSRRLDARKAAWSQAGTRIQERMKLMVSGQVPGIDWHSKTRWDQLAREVGPVRFLFDPPDKKKSDSGIAEDLYNLIIADNSIRELTILSPYVILTERGAKLISSLADRNVALTLVTNSLNSTDNLLAQAGYANDKAWLLKMGINIFHYIGPDTMHAKAIVINGGESVLVGSYNFDPRSAKLNREIGAYFHATDDTSGTVVDSLDEVLARHLSKSHPIERNGIPVGFDRPHPNASFLKRFGLTILRPIVAIPIIKKNL